MTDDKEVKTESVEGYGGHAIQVLWKDTSEVGCAMHSCVKDGWRNNVVVCNYNPA